MPDYRQGSAASRPPALSWSQSREVQPWGVGRTVHASPGAPYVRVPPPCFLLGQLQACVLAVPAGRQRGQQWASKEWTAVGASSGLPADPGFPRPHSGRQAYSMVRPLVAIMKSLLGHWWLTPEPFGVLGESPKTPAPWTADLRPSPGASPPTLCHPQSPLPPLPSRPRGWCAGGMTAWTRSGPGQSLRSKGGGLCCARPQHGRV